VARERGCSSLSIESRAAEIAEFLGKPYEECLARLSLGFGHQHKMVNDDFRRCNPQTDDELLNWYRTTEEYIWELSAYHADEGFNYSGMCGGIATRLKEKNVKSVLCLGDGIGDLSLTLAKAGMQAWYHDLYDSKTMNYAGFRMAKHGVDFRYLATPGWEPDLLANEPFDAVVSLDFLEHVTSVTDWASAIKETLKPGGLFCAQNAFDCGSGANGAIPCHLSINDKYAHAAPHTNGMALWDHLLINELGFHQDSSNWYVKQ
jgi:SAM-dependent methyltransferase